MKFDKKKLLKDIHRSDLKLGFISKYAGIHRTYLYMVLKGDRIPSEDVVNRIYRVLNGKFVLGE